MASRRAAIAYHSSNMESLRPAPGGWRGGRAVSDLPANEEEEEHAEREIEAAEPHQGEQDRASMHGGAGPLGRPEETVNQPGLTAQLGGQPPGGVRDVGEREREHQDPQHGPIAFETPLSVEQDSDEGDGELDRAEPGHDVEGVVQELDV